MSTFKKLFDNNAAWAKSMVEKDPKYFERLKDGQQPEVLWLGCADSRVPPNLLTDLGPGEIFVHRNIANMISHTDLNALSVMQYAIEVLKVKHVVVCGHYSCGGVNAAMGDKAFGLIDNWLRQIKDVYTMNKKELEGISDVKDRARRFVELNVKQQVANVAHTTIVQDAWRRKQDLTVHGVVYGLEDGRLKDLDVSVKSAEQLPPVYRMAG